MSNESLHQDPNWYNQRLNDGGPVYTETDLEHVIVEPWNAISSLLIVLPAVYWLFRIRKNYGDFKFLLYAIPLMILGGTGSTLFHAFRVSRFFLFMDFLPTAILTLSMSIYFWIKVFRKWWYVFFIIIPTFFIRFLFFGNLPDHTAINVSYTLTGFVTGLPLILILYRTGFYKLKYVVYTIVLFIAAIIFRELDAREIWFLPMGTHFLWHAFTGAGAYYLLAYLFYFRQNEISRNNNKTRINIVK